MLLPGDQSDGEFSPVVSAKKAAAKQTNRSERMQSRVTKTRSRQRSLNAVLCGCLSSRSQCATPSEKPSINMNVQLLPSSVVQSVKRLSISSQGDAGAEVLNSTKQSHACRPARGSEETPTLINPARVHLPSSAIITDALSRSRSVDSASGKNSRKSGRFGDSRQPMWRNFKLRRKMCTSFGSKKINKPTCLGQEIAFNNLSTTSTAVPDETDVNEALVFSPLPSQVVPEPNTTSHNSNAYRNDACIRKVDANLLYTPRFDSLFRRHTALLGPRSESDKGKKCFVIDLDETLVHSSFKMVEQADFKVGVEIDGITHRVYVLKRPHVDAFLSTMANLYECVLFTASLAKYADPVADFIDKWNAFRYRLFRESCVYHRGNYVKDLSHLGRPINQVVILDNSPASYMFHANHAVQISSWFDDANDRALLDLIPYFERLASHPNVVDFLRTNTPPTPFAAVGTVGLPPAALPHIPAVDAAGRSADNCSIISNIRRPTVVSPLPVSIQESHVGHQSRETPTAIITSSTVAGGVRKAHVHGPATNQRVQGASTLPVITKVAVPSSGTPVTRSPADQEPGITFPAPLSLATYVPVQPQQSSAVVTSSPTSGNAAQARLNDSVTNSHNRSTPIGRTSASSSSTISASAYLPPGITERPTAFGIDLSSKLPDTLPSDSLKRTTCTHSTKSVCSSSGENHLDIDNAPRRLGAIKHVPGAASPLRTSSPPLSISPTPVSARRINP